MGRPRQVKLNLGCGIYELDGFDNLDKINGWYFETGLSDYPDGSVEAITVSTALLYVELEYWPMVFEEFARVLKPGGVVRVLEADTEHPASRYYGGGGNGAKVLTSASLVMDHMAHAGLDARRVGSRETLFHDGSLIQSHLHSPEPSVFTVEGVKPAGHPKHE